MQPPPTPKAPLVNPAEAWWAAHSLREDRSAHTLLQTEAAGGRHQQSVYELFAEMLEKDGHLYSVVQTRLNGILGLPRRIIPPPPAHKTAGRLTDFLTRALSGIPRFEEMLRALLDGIAKGFAAIELQWGYGPGGELLVTDWRERPQEWFAFSPEQELLLLSPPFHNPGGHALPAGPPRIDGGRSFAAATAAFRPPARTFLLLRFGADVRNPYGRGLAQRAYWMYWFKKNALKFWAVYNEKYGAPTAVATYPQGTREEDRQRLREVLSTLQTDSGVILPEGIELSLLETARTSSGAATYRELLDWCNDEMSKIVLGATLTTGEGRRSGSLALGNIHQLVRQDYIESDARLLEAVLNGSLVAWLMELNFPPGTPRPQWRIDADSPEDLGASIRVDRELLNLGVTLPKSYFYRQYGRPAPTDEDTPLRYDDANFYQYHLQYGVLTINEVRFRLNLPPVPWGDRRTATPNGDPPPTGRWPLPDFPSPAPAVRHAPDPRTPLQRLRNLRKL